MAENAEPIPAGPHVDPQTGNLTQAMRDWLERNVAQTLVSNVTQIGGILSGTAQLQSQINSERAQRIAADSGEQTARIAGDASVAGGGTGDPTESTSGNIVFSGVVTSGATWITAATVTITPTGAGNYTISVLPDVIVEDGANLSSGTTFNGEWRLVEEENGGGTPVTLDSDVFTVTYMPEETLGEGGATIGPFTSVAFTGLPSAPVASNYAVKTDLRLEVRRASGSNDVTAPGLSGSFSVSWA